MQEALKQTKAKKGYLTLMEVQETVAAINQQIQEEQDSELLMHIIY